ncbi:MAG: hypothetical protein ACFFCW_46795, partial [Candidatus Hodarchaeota archaeon]
YIFREKHRERRGTSKMRMIRTQQLNGMARLVHAHARYLCRLCERHLNKRLLGGFRKKVFPTGYTEYQPVCHFCVKFLGKNEKI